MVRRHSSRPGLQELFWIKRRFAGQQLVKQDTQGIDVTARVDVQAAHLGLFRAHVGRCADKCGKFGKKSLVGKTVLGGFDNAEINYLGDRARRRGA